MPQSWAQLPKSNKHILPHESVQKPGIHLNVDAAAATLIANHASDGGPVDKVGDGLARLLQPRQNQPRMKMSCSLNVYNVQEMAPSMCGKQLCA